MKFGDYLREVREGKEWTQPMAAEKADIEQSYLSKLETGKSYPSEEMFDRLIKAYGIDVDGMIAGLTSDEIRKLKAVKPLQDKVLEIHKREAKISRNWLLTGLLSLIISGACFGATFIPDQHDRKYQYRSQGTLLPGEQLATFDSINKSDEEAAPELLQRLNQVDIVSKAYRGESFVEETAEGRRFYRLYAQPETGSHSPRRFFLIPALALLFGALGSYLIGLRRSS
jgi:transcriptional regulator with XRE-family HTH domain